MVKRILSIDGGGIRGVIPARVLAELERRLAKKGNKQPLYKHFDLIAGTSTGGIIALGLTTPNAAGSAPVATAADLEKLYVEKGDHIFPQGFFQKAHNVIAALESPAYSPAGLEGILKDMLHERKLSEAFTRVLITAYDIGNRQAVFMIGKGKDERDFLAREVARATSAGPTYFAPALITPLPPKSPDPKDDRLALVDGGIFANDPTLAAYTEAIKLQRSGAWPGSEPIEIISIGTGLSARGIAYQKAKNWGAIGWVSPSEDVPIVSILMHGQQSTISYQINTMLNPPDVELVDGIHTVPGAKLADQLYFRFNVKLDSNTVNDELDDASETNIAALRAVADQIIHDQSAELDAIVSRLS